MVAGLAFDLHGNRLGHGKGYYDKYLTKQKRLAQEHNCKLPTTVALALDAQILKDQIIPTTEFDQKPDFIISVGQIIRTNE